MDASYRTCPHCGGELPGEWLELAAEHTVEVVPRPGRIASFVEGEEGRVVFDVSAAELAARRKKIADAHAAAQRR